VKLLVLNINGIPDPEKAPEAVNKTAALCDIIREHHVVVLTETRTNSLERLMSGIQESHKLVHATRIPEVCVGRRGFGVAVIAANCCYDYMSLHEDSEDLQCIWIRCNKALFGFEEDLMLCAVYVNPQSKQFSRDDVTNSFSTFFDEFSCAAQVAPHFLLCGDYNAKIGGLSEVSDAHGGLLTAYPALLNARRCKCANINTAGRLLVDFASAAECIIGTGRVRGDDGQPTFVGSIGQKVASRPDHVLMSSRVYEAAEGARILPVQHISDHCVLSMNFRVDNAGCEGTDWNLIPHVCKGGCGSKMVLKWIPERANAYAEVLANNKEIQEQFESAVEEADHEKACFCLRSMIVHAATDYRVGMSKSVSVCAPWRDGRIGSRYPPWFDAMCKEKMSNFRKAVQTGFAVHACQFARRQFRTTARRAKRAYTKRQKAEFLGRLYSKDPGLHAMLRHPKRAQITSLAEPAWVAYLNEHFRPSSHQRLQRSHHGRQGLSAREVAVPLGRNHPPPEVLFRQGACADWIPEPDSVPVPSLDSMRSLVADQIKKMNGSASPGFDEIAAPFIKGAVVLRPKPNGRGTECVNVLEPFVAKLFKLLHDKARIPACWKHAKLSPVYKKGPHLNPNSYRMLAVSGTMYRMYANVIRALLTAWCQETNKIPDTQFGFYPGRNTLQPMFMLRHLQHAARTVQPNRSSRLHAAFIDFKQAYDTIPREALWQHLRRISTPTSLLSVVQGMYAEDEYILKDGPKTARVHPTRGVKQGCPLSPLLFSLYINDVDSIAEGVKGAVTGTEDFCVTHMLYADDLTLLSNEASSLQTMLSRLDVYARKKHLIINTAKSEVVHFNSLGSNLPVFKIGSDTLAHKDSFKYLGMMFYRTLNMAKSAENACRAMLTSAYRIRQFAREHTLADRPHASLWLAKTYVVPAGMYASQIWGTGFMQTGKEFSSALQTLHLNFLKGSLGVKRATTNWAVLRECGHQPLQYYWFRAAVKLYNSMLGTNSNTLRRVVQADLKLRFKDKKCWTAQLVQAFQGLRKSDIYEQAVRTGGAISINDFTADLRHRLQGVWREAESVDPRGNNNKLATYQAWFATPFPCNTRSYVPLPWYLFLDLPKQVVRNVSRFRLRAHTLRVESAVWQDETLVCDRCPCNQAQDEAHVLFNCTDEQVCSLRCQYKMLFEPFAEDFSETQPFLLHQVDTQIISRFLDQRNTKLFFFISKIMDLFLAG
jgi:exonuclease III